MSDTQPKEDVKPTSEPAVDGNGQEETKSVAGIEEKNLFDQLPEQVKDGLRSQNIEEINAETIGKLAETIEKNRKSNQRLAQEAANLRAQLSSQDLSPMSDTTTTDDNDEKEKTAPVESTTTSSPKQGVSDTEMRMVSFMLESRYPYLADSLNNGEFINEATSRGLFGNGKMDINGVMQLAEARNNELKNVDTLNKRIAELEKEIETRANEQPSYTPKANTTVKVDGPLNADIATQILHDPSHPRYKEACDWFADPAHFDQF